MPSLCFDLRKLCAGSDESSPPNLEFSTWDDGTFYQWTNPNELSKFVCGAHDKNSSVGGVCIYEHLSSMIDAHHGIAGKFAFHCAATFKHPLHIRSSQLGADPSNSPRMPKTSYKKHEDLKPRLVWGGFRIFSPKSWTCFFRGWKLAFFHPKISQYPPALQKNIAFEFHYSWEDLQAQGECNSWFETKSLYDCCAVSL